MFLHLFFQKVVLRDREFLVFGVGFEVDRFHPVEQRRRDPRVVVCRRDEETVGEVDRHLDEVVAEAAVLLGVEHFEQSRGGIAVQVVREFVHFVENDDGVHGFRPDQGVDDPTRHRADVGLSVSADIGFVAHAAERNARQFAVQSAGDRHSDRGFTDARRPHETNDLVAQVGGELSDRYVFEDAFLDLVQSVVILVEDLRGFLHVERFFRVRPEGDLETDVEIIAEHGAFGGAEGGLFKTVEFFFQFCLDLFRKFGALDLFGVFVDLVGVLAEFLLNDLDLFAQEIVALVLVKTRPDLLLDLELGLHDHLFLGDQVDEFGEARRRHDRFEDLLFVVILHQKRRSHEVGEHSGRGDRLRSRQRVVRVGGVDLLCVADRREDTRHRLFRLFGDDGRGHDVFRNDRRAQIIVVFVDRLGDGARKTLEYDRKIAVGVLHDLPDPCDRADLIEIAGRRIVDRTVLLRKQKDPGVVCRRRGAERAQRDAAHHVDIELYRGEADRPAKRNDGEDLRFCFFNDT